MSLNSKISIVLATDQNYFPGLWVTLTSLLLHTQTKKHLLFYVFDGVINTGSKQKLKKALGKLNKNHTLEWLTADVSKFSNLRSMEGSHMAYCRLLIPKLLKEEKSIWLDVDLLVLADIEALWNTAMGRNAIAACAESEKTTFDNTKN